MVLCLAIGSLSCVINTARTANPGTKEQVEKTLFGKKECYKAQAPGNQYHIETKSQVFCLISSAVAMAIEDSVFLDVKTIEEMFHPQIPPTKHYILIMHPEVAAKPVLHSEIFDGLIWITSPS
ncbi:hypothetical protein IW261DRAFT_1424858 [Armillaria novae-zelandiae]|uniref:Uncharacterized protein n=1 Tax=Armillaria novae-zelandiae TaxID=153914 RepID=A0AA39NTX8_9AGAR|nr:hypothetical protein IW261DRAFT_1424858 [Armillaria novae-zelandiae]